MVEIFVRCMNGKHRGKDTITGSTVLKYYVSPFSVWCDRFAPAEEREPENKFMHKLFERGISHEKNVRETPRATPGISP